MMKKTHTAFISASRTATSTCADIPCQGVGCIVVIDVTAGTAGFSVVFTLQGKDPISGKAYTILASAAIGAVSTVYLRVHPDLVASAGLIAKDILPSVLNVVATHADAKPITYTVAIHDLAA